MSKEHDLVKLKIPNKRQRQVSARTQTISKARRAKLRIYENNNIRNVIIMILLQWLTRFGKLQGTPNNIWTVMDMSWTELTLQNIRNPDVDVF